MSCNVTSREDGVVVTVTGSFATPDANFVESLLDVEPPVACIVVDLTGAGDRTPLALWLLALQVRRAADRCRAIGFTEGDVSFLRGLGCESVVLAASSRSITDPGS
ncbi:MAG: hypothetical protein U0229_22815 [Anaeromyxobacter sp.]